MKKEIERHETEMVAFLVNPRALFLPDFNVLDFG
jgi:hypothetical protein